MGVRRRRRWLWGALLSILVLICAFLLSLPSLFRMPAVQEKTEAFLAKEVNGNFRFQEGSLTLFPRPRIQIQKVRLLSGSGLSGTINSITFFPHLPSLLRGRFNISRMTLEHPDLTAAIPEMAQRPPLSAVFKFLQDRLKLWADALSPVSQAKCSIDIQEGTFILTQADKPLFSFREIHGRLQWNRPVLSAIFSSTAAFWNRNHLVFSMNVADRSSEGHLYMDRFEPRVVADFIFPDSALRLDEAVLDAKIDWQTDNFDDWDFSFEALDPDITLRKEKNLLKIHGEKVAGAFHTNSAAKRFSLTDVDLASPRLRLTRSFEKNSEKPMAGWQISARDVDIASVKTAAFFFANRFKATHRIFKVLQEGKIPRITLAQEAEILEELRDISKLRINGRLDRATVYVPRPDLLLTDMSADVTVAEGKLEARSVETRLGNSTGKQGSFTQTLTGPKPRPWHVAGEIHADAAQLPPLLGRLSKNRSFSDEMKQIPSLEGRATGTMVLDQGSDGHLDVRVDVSTFDLSGAYQRLPFPLTVSGGGFHYSHGNVHLQNIQGTVGDSRFADLNAKVSWQSSPYLTVETVSADVNVGEITSWLHTLPAPSRAMKDFELSKGRIFVNHFQFEGPIEAPADWRFLSEGKVTSPLDLCISIFPEAMTFYRGDFSMTQSSIEFENADLSVLDAHVHAAGVLGNYLTENRCMEARMDGTLGRGICDWIAEQTRIPETCRWHTPLAVSPLVVTWEEDTLLSVSGQAAIEDGPRISLDITKTPDSLSVHDLSILDKSSRASISLILGKDLLEVGFSGRLNGASVDSLLLENNVLTGSVRGNFRSRYDFEKPLKTILSGRLQSDGLDMTPFGLPLKIDEISLNADGTSVDLSAVRFAWRESDFSSSGRIAQVEEGLLLDLEMNSERLDWPEVKALLGDRWTTKHRRPSFLFGNVRFTCDNFTLSQAMTFQPLKAEFRLNGRQTNIAVQQADACGISFPGLITVTPEQVLFSFEPSAIQQPLQPSLACLQKGKLFMDGRFDLNAKLAFQINGTSIEQSLEGEAALAAEEGRIYRVVLLGKIFSLLNVGGMLAGNFPDLEKDGFPYETSIFKGRFKSGLFELETGVIDSSGMKIFYEGNEDLVNREHNLTVVVAPLKTVDSVVEKIPLINSILEKGMVIYPVKVTGPWDNPQLTLLSPTAVGDEVFGIIGRTLKLPVTVLEKIIHEADKE